MRLTKLKFLNLDENQIRRLPPEVFILNQALEELSMASNRLEAIPAMLPCSLKKLNLEQNLITKISKEPFLSCHMLEEIHLKGNPLIPK